MKLIFKMIFEQFNYQRHLTVKIFKTCNAKYVTLIYSFDYSYFLVTDRFSEKSAVW